jgi:hypothetical protein
MFYEPGRDVMREQDGDSHQVHISFGNEVGPRLVGSDRRVSAGTFPAYRYNRSYSSMSPSPIDCICATAMVFVTGRAGRLSLRSYTGRWRLGHAVEAYRA